MRKEEHQHDHDCHHHDHDHNHNKCIHKSITNNNKGTLTNTHTIIEEPNEENSSSNSKSKNSGQKKFVEMKPIKTNEESITNDLQKFRTIQKEIHKSFEVNEPKNKKKESLTLNRHIKSDFEEIDNEQPSKKRQSENITVNIRKHYHKMDFSSPHVSKERNYYYHYLYSY